LATRHLFALRLPGFRQQKQPYHQPQVQCRLGWGCLLSHSSPVLSQKKPPLQSHFEHVRKPISKKEKYISGIPKVYLTWIFENGKRCCPSIYSHLISPPQKVQ